MDGSDPSSGSRPRSNGRARSGARSKPVVKLPRSAKSAANSNASAGETAGLSSADLWLGQQLRALRKAQGLSLEQLAESSGLSIGNLSQIERGVSSPSIRSLKRLSESLKVPVGEVFHAIELPPAAEFGTIMRRKARPILNLPTTGVLKELLSPTSPGVLQLLMVTIEPGGSSGKEHYTHKGEEAGVVLTGRLELWIEDQRYILNEGDSFRFKSTRPHRFGSASKLVTKVLWATTPPGY
jgi:transcriptional regulator with XRE-family HTH domain